MLSARSEYQGESAIIACALPLDYSFKELKTCVEIEGEEPRSGKRKPATLELTGAPHAEEPNAEAAGDAIVSKTVTSAGQVRESTSGTLTLPPVVQAGTLGANVPTTPRVLASLPPRTPAGKRNVHKITVAVKLNNNAIESLQDVPMALDLVMEDPLRNLQWLDVSWNKLRTIDASLLQFMELKALYLHSNQIKSLPSVEKLKKLPRLISLTLNGNPIEASRSYRSYLIGSLPNLRSLDHSTITEDEIHTASGWFKAHLKRAKTRKEKLENAYLDSLND